jgi:hypothetical protein
MNKQTEILKDLDKLGEELYSKFGTDSYVQRCIIHDLKTKVQALVDPTNCYSVKQMDDTYDKGVKDSVIQLKQAVVHTCNQSVLKDEHVPQFVAWLKKNNITHYSGRYYIDELQTIWQINSLAAQFARETDDPKP